MPIFLPDELEFAETEAHHAWMEAVLLAECGEQEAMPDNAEIPDALNWLRLLPAALQFDFETVECSMVYCSPQNDYACSVWDATGENDDPWAVFVVDAFGPRLLSEYSLLSEESNEAVSDAAKDAVLLRAQSEIPDRAEAKEWNRSGVPLAIPPYLRVPRPMNIE